ncbi:MAG TPA: cyclopropane-fatty-acyl-phospholipid synthase family protein [Quisquiliibacterium sp.]|nr:cyclopropane-fatty-acyl-phospholipid synthase family protein [Quisquiliibacterium sp.]HPA91725.1 cyclopropane-fatty-acyl-phospholipid synthase family protein [Quisquiliibacterium sp.]HQN10954.1 cyclopropane-fatty-acyl-phospholipid synthase family protein [Quisquiliibacterium sp.]HQP65789.1 cyclopropane-fatty-acyl-phospholipid synthase family protein [Quisquiliibacterium sp.]
MLDRQVLKHLEALRGRMTLPLRIRLWNGHEVDLGPDPDVTLILKDPVAARHLARPSMAALGAGYVEGHLDVDGPIRSVVRVAESLARDQDRQGGLGALPNWLTRHTRGSDRQAIEYHYDVSNAFYSAWLDPNMVYSCAYYENGDEDLATAQIAKIDHICRKLRLEPGQRLLDIGCGWGALVIHAARHYGVQATGITLSTNQHALATERVAAAGLQDRVEIRLQDYRDVPEAEGFDRISSVGMFEHVGLKNLPAYFKQVARLLKPGGVALNHGITSSDHDSRSVGLGAGEFIDRYVFPDGELPHVSLAIRELSAAGLELTDAESLRRHYEKTLWAWSDAFEQRLAQMEALAGTRRARIWRVYLAGCAHAFAHGWINLYQLLAVKPVAASTGALSPLPLSRRYMYEGGPVR